MNRTRLVAVQRSVRAFLLRGSTAGVLLLVTALAMANSAGAQVYSYKRMIIDNSNKGDPFNCYARPKQPLPFTWNHHDYLFLDASTDVLIYDIEHPGTNVATGKFGLGYNCTAALGIDAVGNGGIEAELSGGDVATAQTTTAVLGLDGVLGTGVCDECQYGFIDNGSRSILFDLGAPTLGGNPAFVQAWAYDGAKIGLTYKDGTSQYVLAKGVAPNCGADPRSPEWGVYRVVGSTSPASFAQVQCLGASFDGPDWGVEVPGGTGPNIVVYRVDGKKTVVVAKILDGLPVEVGRINTGAFFVDGHDYPGAPAYLLTADPNAVPSAKLYSITASGSSVVLGQTGVSFAEPENYPSGWEIPTVTVSGSGGFALLLTKNDGETAARGLFELRDLGMPNASAVEVDHSYWNDPLADYNTAAHDPAPEKIYELGASFTPDGSGLYLARYYQMAYFDYTGAAQQPTARLSVSLPGGPFPGDRVLVSNDSINWTTARLWITHGEQLTDPVVAGTDTGWGEGNLSTSWTSPVALDCTKVGTANAAYYAHVQIDDTGPSATVPVNFNCSPTASISLSQAAPLAGETVDLTGSGQGNPPAADSAYVWTITPPPDEVVTHPTGKTTQVKLTPGGPWQFGLDLTYEHWNSISATNGAPIYYTAHATSTDLEVASAAPVLSMLPSTTPGPDDQITLSPTDSRVADGVTAHYAFKVDDTTRAGCEGDVTGKTGGEVTIPPCVFAASTVSFDVQHSAKLELTVTGAPALSATKSFTVRSTDVDFSWSPASPTKGQKVKFSISGAADLGHSWNFGGANCEGTTGDEVCDTFSSCSPYYWTYRDAGPHTVTLTLSDNSTVTHSISVQNSGGCTSSCTYTLSGTASFTAAGGGGSITVNTDSGCAWTAQSSTSWITGVTPTSGTGYGSVTFAVAANSGTTSRNGSVTVGGRVFSITQAGTGGGGSVDFSWSPTSPERGETVSFSISGADDRARSWSLGGANCAGETATQSCGAFGCTPFEWAYRDAGPHTVVLNLDDGSTVSHSLTVQTAGSCGTTTCTYSLSAAEQQAAAAGDSGQVSVSSGSSCQWSAASNAGWLSVTSPTGTTTGSGLVRWTAAANPTQTQRAGRITVAGSKTLTVTQAAAEAPPQPTSLILPAAAQTAGDQQTSWRSDLRLYNPSASSILVTLEFLPPYGDDQTYQPQEFTVLAHGTLWIENVISLFAQETATQGAVVITYTGDVAPAVISRTYTSDPSGETAGTYGQQIPAALDTSLAQPGEVLYLTGVEHDASYRTNIGLVNPSDSVATFEVTYHSENGALTSKKTIPLAPKHYVQMSLPAAVGLEGMDLKGSVEVRLTGGGGATAWASVVDQVSGDPIFIQAAKQ